jgi:peptidoglycan/LPS O-acetylase OafA/YrhL
VQTPTSSAGRASRLGALDALRFVAAVSVVCFHFTMTSGAWDGPPPEAVGTVGPWVMYGTMGVSLFFVISGFVVLMTAWGRDVPHFVASRVGRLFPAYWVTVAIAAVISLFLWPAGVTKADALFNLTMLQGAMGAPDIDRSYWTLWTEARFYVLLAVFVLVGITRQRVLAFATVWPLLGAMVAQTDNVLLSTLLIADYAPFFAGGMLLYVIYRDGHDLTAWLLVGLQSLVALHFALGHYPASLAQTSMWPASKAMIAAVSFACFGLVAIVTLTRVNRLNARWMTFLGALTYPLYLVHQKVGLYVIHLMHRDSSPWVAMAVGALVSLLLATALYYTVEKPLGGRLRKAVLRSLRRSDSDSAPSTRADRPASTTRHLPPVDIVRPAHSTENLRRPAREPREPVPTGARG